MLLLKSLQKSYLSKKSSFFTFTAPPSHSHFQFKNSPGYPHMRRSNSRWLLKFRELISEHCLDQRQFPWPDKQLFLIPKISGPDIFSFWTAAGSMQITGVTCSLVQRANWVFLRTLNTSLFTSLTGTHFLWMVTWDQVSFFPFFDWGWAIVSIVFCGNIFFLAIHI